MKIEVSSQRREMLLFLTTNMAATIDLRVRRQKLRERWEKRFRAGAGIGIRNAHVLI